LQVLGHAGERVGRSAFWSLFVREITRSCGRLARSPRALLRPSDLSLPAVRRRGFAT
jgi:hypothetical protein